MAGLNQESRQLFHLGMNFLFSPAPVISRSKFLELQSRAQEQGLVFNSVRFSESEIQLAQEAESLNFQMKVGLAPGAPVGQLLIIEPRPQSTLELFIRKAEAAVKAFCGAWTSPVQVVGKDACIRHLYSSAEGEHAFRFLWEKRLHQTPESIAPLRRPVLGGGVHLVLPPPPGRMGEPIIEVFVESFLEDSKRVFVDTQFKWQALNPPEGQMKPTEVMREIERYATQEVVRFIEYKPN